MGKKNQQIEGLRGIALLCIIFFHFFIRYNQIYHNDIHSDKVLQYLPTIGVFIFCLISGLFVDQNSKRGGINWLTKRVLNIWPQYFLAITFTFIITHIVELPARTVGIVDYLLNIPFINGYIGRPYVDEAHWYLTTLLACLFWLSIILRMTELERRQYTYIAWMLLVTTLFLIRVNLKYTKIMTLICELFTKVPLNIQQ